MQKRVTNGDIDIWTTIITLILLIQQSTTRDSAVNLPAFNGLRKISKIYILFGIIFHVINTVNYREKAKQVMTLNLLRGNPSRN